VITESGKFASTVFGFGEQPDIIRMDTFAINSASSNRNQSNGNIRILDQAQALISKLEFEI
jgi:hypothetical protein